MPPTLHTICHNQLHEKEILNFEAQLCLDSLCLTGFKLPALVLRTFG